MGLIRTSSDGRYFTDEVGKPFFWLGDTQWELFHGFSLADVRTIIDNRRAKGFTTIQVMLTGVGDGTRPSLAGHLPWIDADPSRPNEAYFDHIDTVLELGRRAGLVFVMGIYHQVQASCFTPATAQAYASWVARRYQRAPNIIWSMYPQATEAYVPVVRALAAGLQEGDGGAHLITVHPDPSPASSSFVHQESWLAFNSLQTWRDVDLICPMVSADYHLEPAKPVVMAEGAYEEGTEYGFDVTPLWIRRQAYYSYLAGGHHSYGHNDSWRVLPTWEEALDAPGAYQMGVLREVFESLGEWWRWIPDPSVFADGEGGGSLLDMAARSADGDWVLAYLGKRTTATICMDKLTAGPAAEASWIDPLTGARTWAGIFATNGVRLFSAPDGWQDAVLVLKVPVS